jgi:hypothetical protein
MHACVYLEFTIIFRPKIPTNCYLKIPENKSLPCHHHRQGNSNYNSTTYSQDYSLDMTFTTSQTKLNCFAIGQL